MAHSARGFAVQPRPAAAAIASRSLYQRPFRTPKHVLVATVNAISKEDGEKSTSSVTVSKDEDILSSEEVQKLSQLRKQQAQAAQASQNIVQGAIEEAQLISWPKPKQAFLDTLLVLGILTGTGLLLLTCNILLAELSDWWYKSS